MVKFVDVVNRGDRIELMRSDNLKAFIDLLYRVGGEGLLLASFIYFLETKPILAAFFFYLCSIWHGFWGYAGIGHELYHARVFSNQLLNKLLFRFASYITWNNPWFFERSHRYHHLKTFESNDAEAYALQNWSSAYIFFYVTIDFPSLCRRMFYVSINSLGFSFAKGSFLRLVRACQLEAVYMLTFNLIIQYIITLVFDYWIINLGWFLLPFTGQFFNRILAQSQHIGLLALKDEGPLKNSRTLTLPKLLEFLYAGMNFHAEHHLMPGIPYYNLPRMNLIIRSKGLTIPVDTFSFLTQELWTELRKLHPKN